MEALRFFETMLPLYQAIRCHCILVFRRAFVDYFELVESILSPQTIFTTRFNIYAWAVSACRIRHWIGRSDG
jgi:hypothetical protein